MLDRINKAQNDIDVACETLGRQINVMEVCGTHTVSIFRNGIRTILPKNLKLLSGPGCPVCVTDQGYIDVVLQLADRNDCIAKKVRSKQSRQKPTLRSFSAAKMHCN
jgi:hydrogenase expression/formation protein HypD